MLNVYTWINAKKGTAIESTVKLQKYGENSFKYLFKQGQLWYVYMCILSTYYGLKIILYLYLGRKTIGVHLNDVTGNNNKNRMCENVRLKYQVSRHEISSC